MRALKTRLYSVPAGDALIPEITNDRPNSELPSQVKKCISIFSEPAAKLGLGRSLFVDRSLRVSGERIAAGWTDDKSTLL